MINFIDGQAVEMTAEEVAEVLEYSRPSNEQRIELLKRLLQESDYKTLKYIEGALSETEFQAVVSQRASWRSEINTLGG